MRGNAFDDSLAVMAKTLASHKHCVDLCWTRVKSLGGWFAEGVIITDPYFESKADDNVVMLGSHHYVHFRRGDTLKQCHAAKLYSFVFNQQREFRAALRNAGSENDCIEMARAEWMV